MLGLAGWIRNGESTRKRISELIACRPGIHVSEISERLGLAWSTVEHHLRFMSRKGLVALHKAQREVHVFPAGIPPGEREVIACLQDEARKLILNSVVQQAELGITTLSLELGLTPKVVKTNLEALVEAGLLIRIGAYRPRFRVNPYSVDLLARQPGMDLVPPIGLPDQL